MSVAAKKDIVRIYGSAYSKEAFDMRDFLQRTTAKYEWIELKDDNDSLKHLGQPKLDNINLPVVRMPGGKCLYAPTLRDVAERLGWVQKPKLREYDIAIYGAGPAGLSAAVYAASEGLSTVLVERHSVGGQAGSSSMIENYLGFPGGISGTELAELSRQQAVKFNTELLMMSEGSKAVHDNGIFRMKMSEGYCMKAKASVFATGVKWRKLNLPNEESFLGRGLCYGAGQSEAPLCISRHVAVVGGGNSAGQAVMHLSAYAEKVYMLVRGGSLADSLSQYLVDKILANPKVEVMYNTEVTDLEGTFSLQNVITRDKHTKESHGLQVSYLFACIGGEPNTEWAKEAGMLVDRAGYVKTGNDLFDGSDPEWSLERPPMHLETCIPGVFAVGDCRSGSIKRVATAVGEGASVVSLVHKFLAGDNK